jgi:NADPH-dependent ferric siderophore reductase
MPLMALHSFEQHHTVLHKVSKPCATCCWLVPWAPPSGPPRVYSPCTLGMAAVRAAVDVVMHVAATACVHFSVVAMVNT